MDGDQAGLIWNNESRKDRNVQKDGVRACGRPGTGSLNLSSLVIGVGPT